MNPIALSLFSIFIFTKSLISFGSDFSSPNVYKIPTTYPFPENNAPTPQRIALGKKLFFDPQLSHSKTISCATCHNPEKGWTDGFQIGFGANHFRLKRKTPTILNLAWAPLLNWDGVKKSLEDQAVGPLLSSGGMDGKILEIEEYLSADKNYKTEFQSSYPNEPIGKDLIGRALASFVRSKISDKTRFDAWIEGDKKALSTSEVKGFTLFREKARCVSCHSGWAFTDYQFYDIGLQDNDQGQGGHRFKTPTLRNVIARPPYFHNGSALTLQDVVRFYNRDREKNRLELSKEEEGDLVNFLKTL